MSKQPGNLNAVFGRFRRRMLAAKLSTGAVERRDIGNASEPARRHACQSGRLASTFQAGAWTPCAVSSAAVERSTGTPDHQQALRGRFRRSEVRAPWADAPSAHGRHNQPNADRRG